MIFDDSSDNDWNRQKVLERIQGVVLMRKGADAGPTLEAIHKKVT
jgi:Cu/Ag efflux pump CusA